MRLIGRKILLSLPAILVALISIIVLAYWWLDISIEKFSLYQSADMSSNAAICFLAASAALISVNFNRFGRSLEFILATFILLIGTFTFSQYVFGFPHIGQNVQLYNLSLIASFTFILIAINIFLLALRRHNNSFLLIIFSIITTIIFLIGLFGVISFLYNLQILYTHLPYTRLSILNSICLLLLGIGFWLRVKSSDWYGNVFLLNRFPKINLFNGLILLVVILASGFVGFAMLTKEFQRGIENALNQESNDKINIFSKLMEHYQEKVNLMTNDNLFFYTLFKQEKSSLDLAKNPDFVLNHDFTAIRIYNNQNKLLYTFGTPLTQPDLSMKISPKNNIYLKWQGNDGYFTTQQALIFHGKQYGWLEAEAKLHPILLKESGNLGETSEVRICGKQNESTAICLPSRFNNKITTIALKNTAIILPIVPALEGKATTDFTVDYRNKYTLSAAVPISNTNLALVTKIDAAELFGPLLAQWRILLISLFIIMFIGFILLYSQVSPLITQLLRSKKKLQKSEKRYALAMNGSGAGLWDWDARTNQMFFSPQLKTMLGYQDKEFPNIFSSYVAALHPDDRDMALLHAKNHFMFGTPFDIEFRLRTKSGFYRWFHARGEGIANKKREPIRMVGSLVDTTDRKKAERRLLVQYNMTRALVDNTGAKQTFIKLLENLCTSLHWNYAAIWTLDPEKQTLFCDYAWENTDFQNNSDATKKFIDQTFTSQFKRGEDLPGMVWEQNKAIWLLDFPGNSKMIRASNAQSAELHSAFAFPVRIDRKIQSIIECFSKEKEEEDKDLLGLLNSMGAQIGFYLQRQEMVRELSENEAFESAILLHAQDAILTLDTENKINSFNPKTCEMFHYFPKELSNKPITDLIPAFSQAVFNASSTLEFEAITHDSKNFPVELSISSMGQEKNKMYVVIIRDMTEHKKIEKLKNEFVSMVSHELRTPLTSIRGSLGLVTGGAVGEVNEKIKNLLQIALNNSERLIRLINDILDIEKIEAGKLDFNLCPVDLIQLTKETLAANQAFADKFKVNLALHAPDEKIFVKADPDRLIQILTNLISNAIKFSPTKSLVKVEIIPLEDCARVNVIDQGKGIPAEFQSQIFQKFLQADASASRKFSGTGLGLHIAKTMVEKMNGKIDFISRENQGTTFYIELPLFNNVTVINSSIKMPETITKNPNEKPMVLYIEDDKDLAEVLKDLIKYDANLIHARSLKQALEYLHSTHIDVVILDLILPDGNGDQLIEHLYNNHIPVVVFTALEPNKDYNGYITSYLIKSRTSNDQLITAIRAAMNRARGRKSEL